MGKRIAFRQQLLEHIRCRPGLRSSDYAHLLWRHNGISKTPKTIHSTLLGLESKGLVTKDRESGWCTSMNTPWNWRLA